MDEEERIKDLLKVISILRDFMCNFHYPREEIINLLKKKGFCGDCYRTLEQCRCHPYPDLESDSETDNDSDDSDI